MEITHVKIFPVQEDKLKAFVSVVFDNCFMVNDIKIIQGKDGLFLSMPSRRKKTGEFKDVAHPLNSATRLMLEERVLEEYRLEVDDATPRRPDHEEEEAPAASAPVVAHQGRGAADPSGHANNGSAGDSHPAEPKGHGERAEDTASGPDSENRHADKNGSSGSLASSGDDTPDGADSDQHEPSLEEVQEKILQDSFWSRPIDRSS